MTEQARMLVVQNVPPSNDRVLLGRHPGCSHLVRDGGVLVAIDADGLEVHGYADGTWVQWWYEPDNTNQSEAEPA
ncbi:MAG TPA: hypothetical protein VG476_04540 [Acidimicrobiales bacterium]|nr:hypothetical protein [Acidimicrobiales bacterium]